MSIAYKDGSLKRRADRVRGEEGSNGEGSCAVAPTARRVQCKRSRVMMVRVRSTKNLHGDLVGIAAELGNRSLDPSQG